jgi:hypothetical protein
MGQGKKMGISPGIKGVLGFSPDTDDEIVHKWWERRTKNVCKPCWELKYCPYGNLVEQFPLSPSPVTREEAIELNELTKAELAKDDLDEETRKTFEGLVNSFNPNDYPEQISKEEREARCSVFGHLCPVFFVNEPFTETAKRRRIGRYIPRSMMIRIVRRDNYTCQECGKHLKDNELEFDHIIPISKGGSSEEHNIRLVCYDCNRRKSNNVGL